MIDSTVSQRAFEFWGFFCLGSERFEPALVEIRFWAGIQLGSPDRLIFLPPQLAVVFQFPLSGVCVGRVCLLPSLLCPWAIR